jgi:gas vesicle protein
VDITKNNRKQATTVPTVKKPVKRPKIQQKTEKNQPTAKIVKKHSKTRQRQIPKLAETT